MPQICLLWFLGKTGCAIVRADAQRASAAQGENVSLSNSLACMTVRGHVARGNGTTLNFKHNFSFASFQCNTAGGGIRMHKIDCMKR